MHSTAHVLVLPVSPTISVVMTSFNSARTLDRCLQAVLNQTIKPIEVVVVDAGSTDGSIDIIKRYESSGVRLIIKPNCGHGEGEFLAEQEAKGDFVAITNPDVYVYSDWIELCYRWVEFGYQIVGGIKVNAGDVYNFAWTALPDKEPWQTEKPELGLTSMSTFASRQLLLSFPIITESRDVEVALMAKKRGLSMIIDPNIKVIHDEPLGSTRNSFRKSAAYSTRHIQIMKSMYGKPVFGGSSGISFSYKHYIAELLLIDAVKTYLYYKPMMKEMTVKTNVLQFMFLRAVFLLGQIYGVARGFLRYSPPSIITRPIKGISIIIPMLNESRYLHRTLTAIANQTIAPLETICIDGGSVDNSQAIAMNFTGTKLVVKNGLGECDSRNYAADISQGDILFFMSADVIIQPDTIELLTKDFNSDSKLLGVVARPLPFESSSSLLRFEYHGWNVMKRLFFHLPRPIKQFVTSSSFTAVRKDTFMETGKYDPSNVNNDGELGIKLVNMGRTLLDTRITYMTSGRRYNKSGFVGFNTQFIYNVVEDFFPFVSRISLLDGFKRSVHKMHKPTGVPNFQSYHSSIETPPYVEREVDC